MVEPQQRHAVALRALCASHAPALQLATSLVGPPGMDAADFVVLDDSGAGTGTGSPMLAEVVAWMDEHGWRVHDVFDLTRRGDGVMLQVDLLFVRKGSRLDVQLAGFGEPGKPA